jgi:choline transporter-like protein 2/4/5
LNLSAQIFLAFVGGWAGVGIYGFQRGNPLMLVYPSNSEGDICGRGNYTYVKAIV